MDFEEIACSLCGGSSYTPLLRTRDYRFKLNEYFNFVRCKDCGLIYLNPRPTANAILKRYEEDYGPSSEINRSKKLRHRSNLIRYLVRFLYKVNGTYSILEANPKGRFLDVGCGNGDTLEKARDMGADVFGVDINYKCVSLCQNKMLNVRCGSVEDVQYPDNFFNTIWISQTIEHLPYPNRTMKDIFRILKPGGFVYIMTPNAESYLAAVFRSFWQGWHAPFHFQVYAEKTIRRLSESAGFIVVRIKFMTPGGFFAVSIKAVLFAKIGKVVRPIDHGKIFDSFLFKALIAPIFRIFDFLLDKKGDCLVVILRKREVNSNKPVNL